MAPPRRSCRQLCVGTTHCWCAVRSECPRCLWGNNRIWGEVILAGIWGWHVLSWTVLTHSDSAPYILYTIFILVRNCMLIDCNKHVMNMIDGEQRNDIDILPVYPVGWVCYCILRCWVAYFALGWTAEETEPAMYRLIGWKQQLYPRGVKQRNIPKRVDKTHRFLAFFTPHSSHNLWILNLNHSNLLRPPFPMVFFGRVCKFKAKILDLKVVMIWWPKWP